MSLVFAFILLGLAAIVSVGTGIWMLVLAFRKRIWWGLAVLFVPLANLVFLIVEWSEAKRPFFFSLLAIPLGLGGFFLIPKDKLATLDLARQLATQGAAATEPDEASALATGAAPASPATVAPAPKPAEVEARLADLHDKEALLLNRKKRLDPKNKAAALALSQEIAAYNAELQAALAARQQLLDSGALLVPATTPAAGQIAGLPFTVEKATLKDGILTLRQGSEFFADREVAIFLFLKDGENPAGRKWQIAASKDFGQPHVHLSWRDGSQSLPKTKIFMNDYQLHLEFEPGAKGALTGKIVLTTPDERKSTVNGIFTAQVVATK